ncbi:MAG: hypothetical protein EXQ74_07240 [Thermoleophilia bacterium]|nr:hypothetical protein [Thermoleophilia bacterium]
MYRDDDDIQLLTELAGVLDQVVLDAGLSSGSYMLLRELTTDGDGMSITALATHFRASPEEIGSAAKALSTAGLAEVDGAGLVATGVGRQAIEVIEQQANVAMRDYVLERPHSATVYGLVASMQSGRFTVADLLEFVMEDDPDDDGTVDRR